MSKFVMGSEVPVEGFDWGTAGMRCSPPTTGCGSVVVMDVRLDPGGCHAFHLHPDQDEMIVIKSGRLNQYIESELQELGPGDSVYIDRGVVHGSYNDGDEPSELQIILAPAIGEGYVAVPVDDQEPWASLR